ncbi:MAG: hypothetical protein GXP45_05090 [bacterium]|nr:hypothetical protein [bacterium]
MGGKLKPGDWVKIMFGPQVHAKFLQYYGAKLQLLEKTRTGVDAPGASPYLEEL